MILYYAMGGGLGHLSRARAVLHTLGLESRASILTSSPHAEDPRVAGAVPVIRVPADLDAPGDCFHRWMNQTLTELRPEAIYLDVFPAGIRGELCDLEVLKRIPVHCIARRLRWNVYARHLDGEIPRFDCSFLLEPLEPDHEHALIAHSAHLVPLDLRDPSPAPGKSACSNLIRRDLERPLWAVVHSGPSGEVQELLSYAMRMREVEQNDAEIVVVTASDLSPIPTGVRVLDLYPSSAVFELADRVITACGFNVMRQLAGCRARHRFLPFPRQYDDQFWRSAYVRSQSQNVDRSVGIKP